MIYLVKLLEFILLYKHVQIQKTATNFIFEINRFGLAKHYLISNLYNLNKILYINIVRFKLLN